jgi:hypothetical protein
MRGVGLWKNHKPMRKGMDKTGLLNKFMTRGYFLVDVCGTPVDKMMNNERNRFVQDGLVGLTRELRKTNPGQIIIVKTSIYDKVKGAIDKGGYRGKLRNVKRPIPFPSHGSQSVYRRRVSKYLR